MEICDFCRAAPWCVASSVLPVHICVHRHTNSPSLCTKKRAFPLVYTGRTEIVTDKKRLHGIYGLNKIWKWFSTSYAAILTFQTWGFFSFLSKRHPLYISEFREFFYFSVEVFFLYYNAFVVPITATTRCFLSVTGEDWKGNILNK